MINQRNSKTFLKGKRQSRYLSNSFGASVPHHVLPPGHQCNPKDHPHKDPRNQPHFRGILDPNRRNISETTKGYARNQITNRHNCEKETP